MPKSSCVLPPKQSPETQQWYDIPLFRHFWWHHTIYRKIRICIQGPSPRLQPSLHFQSHWDMLCFSQGNNLLLITFVPSTFHFLCGGGWSSCTMSTYGHMLTSFISSIPPSSGNALSSSFWTSQGNWDFSDDVFHCFIRILTSFLLNFITLSLEAWSLFLTVGLA